ncbi:zf-HC2 domain-containing protein [Ruminococcus sp.]|uniref:zf-HC2 domain-containing protein n=1 Tax=Ruminococcus sp. TaxID=41978 RepID=UPI00388F9A40
MDIISCQVINDLLPLYVDDVVSEETRTVIENHLTECRECTIKAERMKWNMEKEIKEKAAQAEKKALLSAREKIRKKRIITAVISVISVTLVMILAAFIMRNIRIPIKFDANNFRVKIEEEYDEEWLYLYYDGLVSGHNLVGMADSERHEEQMYIEMYTTPWDEIFKNKESRSDKNRIGICPIDDERIKVTELRLITGDLRMMYAPSRDYDQLMESSVLLWERNDK